MTNSKFNPELRAAMASFGEEPIPVIVELQEQDGRPARVDKADREALRQVGGEFKDDLYIIASYSAKISEDGLRHLSEDSRIKGIQFDGKLQGVEE